MRYLRIAAGLLLLSQSLSATVIGGSIVNVTGQPMSSNRSIVFTLENCGSNIPLVQGSAIVVPAAITMRPNPAGLLAGTIVGNDIISCGTLLGQTYYQVTVFAGSLQIYQQNFIVAGPIWNIATAVPMSNDPTAFLNYAGGQPVTYHIGDLISGNGNNTLGIIAGNTANTWKFLCQIGTITGQSTVPQWCPASSIVVPAPTTLPALSGDIENTGTSTDLTVNSIGGGVTTAAAIAAALTSFGNSGLLNHTGLPGLLKSVAGSNVTALAVAGTDYYKPGAGQTNGIVASDLPYSGVIAGNYGSGAGIPVIAVDATGRITSISIAANGANQWAFHGPALYYAGGHVLIGTSSDNAVDMLQIGGWAYCVPAFGLEMAAVEVGSSVEWFELAGVVEGIEGICGIEHSARPIHVHTDSAFVGCLLKHLIAGQPYPSRRSFERVMDLIRRLAGPCGQRNLRCSPTQRKNPLIRNCHLAAPRKVREYVATDPILTHRLAFKREESKLSTLSAERETLCRRLENIEEEVRLCKVKVSVLSMTAQPDRPETNHNVRDLLGNPSSKQLECAAAADAAGLYQAEIKAEIKE
jgi:hypothetical protein